MSLAATTNSQLTLLDAATLKVNATGFDAKAYPISAAPIASAWSPDNATLYVASAHVIHAFSPTSAQFTTVYAVSSDAPLAAVLVSRDTSTLIIAQDTSIRLLSTTSRPPKVTATLPPHATPVKSVAISNDATLLASASAAGALHVYNLSHNTNSVLRAFPAATRAPCVCVFDPHQRTRLLVGAGSTLAVYDTSRTGGPLKTIAIAEKGAEIGHVVAISSSPYSKTLVAVACTTLVALIDLEKDNSVYRSVPVKAPVTSMVFTADGNSLAMGTETGKILIQELRKIEHAQRSLDAGKGARIVALSIQKRVKSSSSLAVPRLPPSHSVPLTPTTVKSPPPARRAVSSKSQTPTRSTQAPIRVFSPPRAPPRENDDAGDISVQVENLMDGSGGGGDAKKVQVRPSRARPAAASASMSQKSSVTPISETTASRALSRSGARGAAPTPSAPKTRISGDVHAVTPSATTVRNTRTMRDTTSRELSSERTGRPSSRLTATSTSSSRMTSTAPSDGAASCARSGGASGSDIAPTPAPSDDGTHNAPGPTRSVPAPVLMTSEARTRTATPDLPSIDVAEPPLRPRLLKPGYNLITTPELERWVEAGRGKQPEAAPAAGRRVGWVDADADKENAAPGGDDDDPTVAPRSAPALDMSPVRRPPPLQLSPHRGNAANGAQELLRGMVKDVMYEYRRETREDVKGLHLDLLKVGRSWKNELRAMMQEYVGDLRDLREENARLRAENDRLRRGY